MYLVKCEKRSFIFKLEYVKIGTTNGFNVFIVNTFLEFEQKIHNSYILHKVYFMQNIVKCRIYYRICINDKVDILNFKYKRYKKPLKTCFETSIFQNEIIPRTPFSSGGGGGCHTPPPPMDHVATQIFQFGPINYKLDYKFGGPCFSLLNHEIWSISLEVSYRFE